MKAELPTDGRLLDEQVLSLLVSQHILNHIKARYTAIWVLDCLSKVDGIQILPNELNAAEAPITTHRISCLCDLEQIPETVLR